MEQKGPILLLIEFRKFLQSPEQSPQTGHSGTSPGCSWCKEGQQEGSTTRGSSGSIAITELAVAWGPGISGTHRGFSDPLPRFQMLVNLPALFLTALSSHPRALRLHSAPYVHPPRERLPRQSSSSN